jgi:hypothetical protein
LINRTIPQEEIVFVNIYAPLIATPAFIKQKLLDLEAQIDPRKIILGNFNTPFSPINRSFGPKKRKNLKLIDNVN